MYVRDIISDRGVRIKVKLKMPADESAGLGGLIARRIIIDVSVGNFFCTIILISLDIDL